MKTIKTNLQPDFAYLEGKPLFFCMFGWSKPMLFAYLDGKPSLFHNCRVNLHFFAYSEVKPSLVYIIGGQPFTFYAVGTIGG